MHTINWRLTLVLISLFYTNILISSARISHGAHHPAGLSKRGGNPRPPQQPDFCADFERACMKSCIQPHFGHISVSYKCENHGSEYEFDCSCGDHDNTNYVLAEIIHQHTTVTVTKTKTVPNQHLATRIFTIQHTKTITTTINGRPTTFTTAFPVTSTVTTIFNPTTITIIASTVTFVESTLVSTVHTGVQKRFLAGEFEQGISVKRHDDPNHGEPDQHHEPSYKDSSGLCSAYSVSCHNICGAHDIRSLECDKNGKDSYHLLCQCRNGHDESYKALQGVDHPITYTVTKTKTVTSGQRTTTVVRTADVTRRVTRTKPPATIVKSITSIVPETLMVPTTVIDAVAATSTTVELVAPSGYIRVLDTSRDFLGYVGYTFLASGTLGLVDLQNAALPVAPITAGDDGTVASLFGFIGLGNDYKFVVGSFQGIGDGSLDPNDAADFALLAIGLSNPRGPAQDVGNSNADGMSEDTLSESAIWFLDLDTLEFSPSWINGDGQPADPTQLVLYSDGDNSNTFSISQHPDTTSAFQSVILQLEVADIGPE